MLDNGNACILGTFSSAGYMFDLFFNILYNQACIYYIERLLALKIM